MITIKYFDGEKHIEIEVAEEFAESYREICREERRIDKREKRHSAVSLEQLEEHGCEIVDPQSDPLETMIERKRGEELRKKIKGAWSAFTAEQKNLVRLLRQGMGIREIARKLGKSHTTVLEMKKAIKKKMENFLP